MKPTTTIRGVFSSHHDAENAVEYLSEELHVPLERVVFLESYIPNRGDEHTHNDTSQHPDDSADIPTDSSVTGLMAGGILGAIVGVGILAGVVPLIEPLSSLSSFFSQLGLGSAVGIVFAAAVVGAFAGFLIGMFTRRSISHHRRNTQAFVNDARTQEEVMVLTPERYASKIQQTFFAHGALSVDVLNTSVRV